MTDPRQNLVSAYVWGVCGAAGAFAALVGMAVIRAAPPTAGAFGPFACIAGIGGIVVSIAALLSLRKRS